MGHLTTLEGKGGPWFPTCTGYSELEGEEHKKVLGVVDIIFLREGAIPFIISSKGSLWKRFGSPDKKKIFFLNLRAKIKYFLTKTWSIQGS